MQAEFTLQLARSRYVLYKKPNNWLEDQRERADLLFERYPNLLQPYNLSMNLSGIFENIRGKIIWSG